MPQTFTTIYSAIIFSTKMFNNKERKVRKGRGGKRKKRESKPAQGVMLIIGVKLDGDGDGKVTPPRDKL